MITSLNDSLVERDLHRCVSDIEHAAAAPEGGCKDGPQAIGAKSGTECLGQPVCERRRNKGHCGHRRFPFSAARRAAVEPGHLERLHKCAPFAAHAQRHALAMESLIRRIIIGGFKAPVGSVARMRSDNRGIIKRGQILRPGNKLQFKFHIGRLHRATCWISRHSNSIGAPVTPYSIAT